MMEMTRDRSYYDQGQAGDCDGLIGAQPNLLPWLLETAVLSGRRAVDLGAGTGRLTLEMLPYVESATAVDASAEMLERLALKAGPQASSKLEIVVADYASTGLPSGAYDLIVSGWAVCYCASSTFPGWEERLDSLSQR